MAGTVTHRDVLFFSTLITLFICYMKFIEQ